MLVAVVALSALGLPEDGAGAAAARHTPAGPVYGGTLHVAYTSNMVAFDPAQAYSDDWWVMMGTLYNGLYQFDRNGRPQLDLAAGPPYRPRAGAGAASSTGIRHGCWEPARRLVACFCSGDRAAVAAAHRHILHGWVSDPLAARGPGGCLGICRL